MSFQHPAHTRTGHQVSTRFPFIALAPPSFPSRRGSSFLIDCRSEGSLTVDNYACRWTSRDMRSRCRRQLITFDMLPDDALLEIFDIYVDEGMDQDFKPIEKQRIEEWIKLAHVCRRWRSVVFQSPCRLNLRLLCTCKTRARNMLDVWLPLPLIVRDFRGGIYKNELPPGPDNIIAALEHNDRVCQIKLDYFSSSELGCVTDSAAMRKPFPELTHLWLSMVTYGGLFACIGPILPNSFLGGTAPRLRSLILNDIPFPGLPKLLLSATHLVDLSLCIPSSGYIPPMAMATSLSALTSLESLHFNFRCPRPRPALESRLPPPPPLTRSILPSLTKIQFKGASEYLEAILARIDAPRLDDLHINFFNQIIFDTPQLSQFISRRPTLRAPEKGHIEFNSNVVSVKLPSQTPGYPALSVAIRCETSEWQLSSLEQVCSSSLPPLSSLEDLYISEGRGSPPRWQHDIENTLWLDLLRSFVAVKNLYLSEDFVPRIAPALQELVGARTTEVLPTLENIFLDGPQPSGPLQEGIKKFVAARQLTSHPVAVPRYMNPERYKYPYGPYYFLT